MTTKLVLDPKLQPSPEMKEAVAAVEKILGHDFINKRLLEEALTHSSVACSASYERLEILGDSALNHAVTNYFFRMAGRNFTQGQITLLRSANVGNQRLAVVSVHLGLYTHLRRNTPALNEMVKEFTDAVNNGEDKMALVGARKVLADIVESVAAAIYIDMNFDLDKLWVKFKPLLEPIVTLEELEENAVSMLNELCQKNGKHLRFKQRPRNQNEDTSTFDVFVDDKFVASGCSQQQNNAKRIAAKEALDKLPQLMVVNDGLFEGIAAGIDVSFQIVAAKEKLHAICGKKRWPQPTYKIEKEEGPPHDKKFVFSLKIATLDGEQCTTGDAKSTKKAAMNSAAFLMIRALQERDYINTK